MKPVAALLRPPERQPMLSNLHWPDSTVAILASGSSLSEEQCETVRKWRLVDPVGRRRVIAINTTFLRAPWADILYACDFPWWEHYGRQVAAGKWQHFGQQLWTQDVNAARIIGMHYVRSAPAPGLGRTPGLIHQGGNGAYQAVNLAYQAGARRIVLLGCDMRGTKWHGEHPAPLTNPKDYLFAAWIRNFKALAMDLASEGVTVINASPGSALPWFQSTNDLAQALQ